MSAQPLSPPLQRSLRFFHVPVPTPPSASLAGRFPDAGRDMGLPCFVPMPEWVRSIPFRRELFCSRQERTHLLSRLHPLLGKPMSTFGLFSITTFIRISHTLSIPLNPSS